MFWWFALMCTVFILGKLVYNIFKLRTSNPLSNMISRRNDLYGEVSKRRLRPVKAVLNRVETVDHVSGVGRDRRRTYSYLLHCSADGESFTIEPDWDFGEQFAVGEEFEVYRVGDDWLSPLHQRKW